MHTEPNIIAKKMKILQTIREQLKILGIEPTTSSFNRELLLGFLYFIMGIIFSALYLVDLAKSTTECIQCFCTISGMIGIGIGFANIVIQKRRLFKFIYLVEELINHSEYITMNSIKFLWIRIFIRRKFAKCFRIAEFNIACNPWLNQSMGWTIF